MTAAGLDAACAAARAVGIDPASVRVDLDAVGLDFDAAAVAGLERVTRSPRAALAGGSFVLRMGGRSVGWVWLELEGGAL